MKKTHFDVTPSTKVKKVMFDESTKAKIAEAVDLVLSGSCARVEINNVVKVYECKGIVRIDLKVIEN